MRQTRLPNESASNRTTSGLNETFPLKVCINLARRPERWRRMQAEFARVGIEAVRFSACDGNKLTPPANWGHTAGAYGCLLSHLQVVQEARESGAPSVLIFEDDTVFDPEFEAKFSTFIKEVPLDWDMLYFGALHKDEPIRINDHVYKLTRANSTYAYAIRNTVFDEFIELNRKAEHVLDMNAYHLQERFNCYCFLPNLAWVKTEYSDVQNRLERHWYLERSLVLFGPEIDSLLNATTIVFAHSAAEAQENLMFLARYYHEFFSPSLEIVIVEQGAKTAIERARLPQGCKHIFLNGPFDRNECFNAGMANSDPNKQFFILSDDDLYLETLDIRANLRMCLDYDSATGFSEVIELTPDQASLLQQTSITRGIDVTKATPAANVKSQCRFIRRNSNNDRIFQSPNHALRLP